MTLSLNCLLLIASILIVSSIQKTAQPSTLIFYGGDILTMDPLFQEEQRGGNHAHKQVIECAVVMGGKIKYRGTLRGMQEFMKRNQVNGKIQRIDLKGKTLMPGFYDAHSHFGMNAKFVSTGFDISPPPIGETRSITMLIQIIKNYIETNKIAEGKVIFGAGYSDIGFQENRHPTRYELDAISTKNPIMLLHISGHMGVVNSLLLESLHITDINDNLYPRYPNGTLNGLLKEAGIFNVQDAYIPVTTKQTLLVGQQNYLSVGITTAQTYLNPSSDEPQFYKELGDDLVIDVLGYLFVQPQKEYNVDTFKDLQTSNFKMKGIKVLLDGSIQGYTAYLKQPYYVQPKSTQQIQLEIQGLSTPAKTNSLTTQHRQKTPSTQEAYLNKCKEAFLKVQERNGQYRGVPSIQNQTLLNEFVLEMYNKSIDILMHSNGDAAAQQMIEAVAYARNKTQLRNNRAVMIHSQYITYEQLDRIQEQQITPSFFPSHTYFWGLSHYNTFLGPKRAPGICKANTAAKKKMLFTFHNDAPVTPIKPFGIFQIIWSAVNRIMYDPQQTTDEILGEDERVSVYEALRAVTINAAWQAREHEIKGSISEGKRADLIILQKNPLKMEVKELRNNKVLHTFKDGRLVFSAEGQKMMKEE